MKYLVQYCVRGYGWCEAGPYDTEVDAVYKAGDVVRDMFADQVFVLEMEDKDDRPV